jgi:hypothetical protein
MDHNYHLKPRDYQMKEMEMVLLESDSDDEMEILSIFAMEEERLKRERASTSRRGSIVGHKVIKRDYLQGEERLFHDYFSNNPVFPPHLFRMRFRMSRPLFFRLQSARMINILSKKEMLLERLVCHPFKR